MGRIIKKKSNQSKIPADFDSVIKAVEEVCSEFDSEEPFHYLDPKRWIRYIELDWDDHVKQVAFVLDIEFPLLAVYVILRLPDAEHKLTELAKAISRANFGLLPGCFELDFDSGEVRFRNVLIHAIKKMETRNVAPLLADALLVCRTYTPAFQKITEADSDPIGSVDEIEA